MEDLGRWWGHSWDGEDWGGTVRRRWDKRSQEFTIRRVRLYQQWDTQWTPPGKPIGSFTVHKCFPCDHLVWHGTSLILAFLIPVALQWQYYIWTQNIPRLTSCLCPLGLCPKWYRTSGFILLAVWMLSFFCKARSPWSSVTQIQIQLVLWFSGAIYTLDFKETSHLVCQFWEMLSPQYLCLLPERETLISLDVNLTKGPNHNPSTGQWPQLWDLASGDLGSGLGSSTN